MKKKLLILLAIAVVAFAFGFFTTDTKKVIKENQSAGNISSTAKGMGSLVADMPGNGIYSISMLSSSDGGIVFEVGQAFVDALNDLNYDISTIVTGGVKQSVNSLLQNKGQLLIMSSDKILQAYRGEGLFTKEAPAKDLRVLMSLWANYWQIIVKKDSGIVEISHLEGKKIAVDDINSISDLALHNLFKVCNVNMPDGMVEYTSLEEGLEGLEDGTYAAIFFVEPLNNHVVENVEQQKFPVLLVQVDDQAFSNLVSSHPYYMRGVIPQGTYNIEGDVPTVMTMTTMLVSKDIPEQVVYDLLGNFFDNLDDAKNNNQFINDYFAVENPAIDMGVPLHEGAARYYRDNGYIK